MRRHRRSPMNMSVDHHRGRMPWIRKRRIDLRAEMLRTPKQKQLGIDWLRKNLIALPENNKWQALSRSALLSDGYFVYILMANNVLNIYNTALSVHKTLFWQYTNFDFSSGVSM